MQPAMSFDLNEEMIDALEKEFDVQKVIAQIAQATAGKGKKEIEAIAREVFGDYGKRWMERAMELGEKFTDRTYEVLKTAAAKTGQLIFPHIPQRFIEIAYLATQPIGTLDVMENSARRLVYMLPEDSCATFQGLKKRFPGEITSALPCQEACLTAARTLYSKLSMPVEVSVEASMPRDGYCQFAGTCKQ